MKLSFAVAGATMGISLAGQAAHGAAVLTDTFATSTLNAASPGAPTSSSTNYAVLSSKNATTSSIAASDLKIGMGSTSSGFVETQALFRSTPLRWLPMGTSSSFSSRLQTPLAS
jgi:hypothetical protein